MSLPSRFTIERKGAAAARGAKRFLGHDDAGRLVWMASFTQSNTFDSDADAASFRRNRLSDSTGAAIVRHTVH